MNPTEISSIFLTFNIFFTIYNGNYILLLTEIQIVTTSLLHHHRLIKNIKQTDVIVAHYAYWHHMYFAYYYSDLARYAFIMCPILFIFSHISAFKNNIYISQIFHASMHYMLSFGNFILNMNM